VCVCVCVCVYVVNLSFMIYCVGYYCDDYDDYCVLLLSARKALEEIQ